MKENFFVKAQELEVETEPGYTLQDKLRNCIKRQYGIGRNEVLFLNKYQFDKHMMGYYIEVRFM